MSRYSEVDNAKISKRKIIIQQLNSEEDSAQNGRGDIQAKVVAKEAEVN